MKKQVTILAAILIVSSAFTQERQRTQSSSQNNNQRARSVQQSSTKGSTSSTKSSSTYKASGTQAQRNTSAQNASNSNRQSGNHSTRSYSNNNRQSGNHTASSYNNNNRRTAPANVSTQHKEAHQERRYNDHTKVVYYDNKPKSRHSHVTYHSPVRTYVRFSPEVRHTYVRLYPHIDFSIYPVGYELPYISAYRARYYKGQFASVYGIVLDVYYSRDYDEYYLYVGQHYPRHDFSIVVPGYIARGYSNYPGNYFLNEEVCITGYVDSYNGRPEMIVKANTQFNIY